MYPTHEEIAKSLIKAADNFEGDLKEEGTVGAYDALFEISEAMGIKFNADYSFILRELSKCIDPTATAISDCDFEEIPGTGTFKLKNKFFFFSNCHGNIPPVDEYGNLVSYCPHCRARIKDVQDYYKDCTC